MFKIIQMPGKVCDATKNKMICLLQLKRKLLHFLEGVTIQEKFSRENVLFCVIQVDSLTWWTIKKHLGI